MSRSNKIKRSRSPKQPKQHHRCEPQQHHKSVPKREQIERKPKANASPYSAKDEPPTLKKQRRQAYNQWCAKSSAGVCHARKASTTKAGQDQRHPRDTRRARNDNEAKSNESASTTSKRQSNVEHWGKKARNAEALTVSSRLKP